MTPTKTIWNLAKTVLFLAVFWSVFLLALPLLVAIVEVDLGIQRFPPQFMLATVLLLIFTLLAVWAAVSLAVAGEGTPMSFDPPRTLVVSGPYAFVRHPFVAAVTGQVVALGIALGSVPVIAYGSALLAIWYFFVRKREERLLDERFGKRARDYCANVRGFRPRLTPYRVR